MDLDALKKCKDNSDFDQLMMEDILRGYTDHVHYPNHEQIAIVDHLGNYDLNQIRSFFDTVHQDLDVQFWVGDAISLNIEGQIFHRYFLYSDEDPDICMQFSDEVYRMQEPEIERYDGITIDLRRSTVTFKNDGEELHFDSEEQMQIGLNRILTEYWPEQAHPDVRIEDSISKNSGTKWIIESFSDFLMSLDSQTKRITLARRLETFIPEFKFELTTDDYLPYSVALQLATQMNKLDQSAQEKVYSSLTKVFGLFDDYRTDLDD